MSLKNLIRKLVPGMAVKTLEKSYRKGRGIFWQAWYGFPAKNMKVIAVTGTNGKSTTCAYINEVLKAAGYKTAILTTVFYEVNGKRDANQTHHTIDKQSIAQNFFARAHKAKVDYVIFEVTSHAIDQDRIMGVPVEIAVITNLTPEHLDYHKTMKEYARVKSLLVRDYGAKWAILNHDDEYYDYFRERSTAKVFSFGKYKQPTEPFSAKSKKPEAALDASIQSVELSDKGSQAVISTELKQIDIKTSLLGEVNIYNASVAASVGLILGLESQDIEKGIANLNQLDGRLQKVDAGQKFMVLVDFAVTPDAIKKVLTSLKQIAEGRVSIVFGATGDRDKAKRPLMGEVVAELADKIFLTDDETYNEDPETIRQAVYAGIKKKGGENRTDIIPDRREAIEAAFAQAEPGDIVLLTGIGHEDHRNMAGKQIPWNEAEIAREILEKL